jgi:hypothetical protein
MKPSPTTSEGLVTHLLVLPDGSVLAENLTPSMAAVLEKINVRTDPGTQASLRGDQVRKTIVNRGGMRKTGHTSDTGNLP